MMNKKLLKKLQISLVSLSAVGLLAACGNDTNTDSTTPPVEEQEETTTEESSTDGEQEVVETPNTGDYANLTVKPEEAFDVYRDKYPNAKITQVQLDQDMGNFVYKVDGFEGTTEYELKIDPMDATILKEDTDTDKDDDLDEMEITREQAVYNCTDRSGDTSLFADHTADILGIKMQMIFHELTCLFDFDGHLIIVDDQRFDNCQD